MNRLGARITYLALVAVTVFGGTFSVANAAADQSKLISITNEARSAYNARQFELAEQKYAEAVKIAGATIPARSRIALLSNLGAAYREDHKYVEAEDAFKKALSLADDAHLNYDASTKLAMQQYAMLLRKMKRVLEADAMEVRAAAGVVVAGTKPVEPVKPTTSIDTAKSLQPTNPKQITLTINVEDDFKTATLDELKQRRAHDPTNWRRIAQVGAKYLEVEKYAEAAEEFKQALRNADSATAAEKSQLRYFMSEAFYKADNFANALDGFRQLASDNPDDPRFLMNMAVCYDALGDMTSELAAWELFVQRWPNDANVAGIKDNIERLRKDVANGGRQGQNGDNQPSQLELRSSFIGSKMPLKVFINGKDDDRINFVDKPGESQVTESTPGAIVERALRQWTEATQARVTFELVNDAAKADITCSYTEEPDGLEVDSAAGLTTYRKTSSGHAMDIQLLTVIPQTSTTTSRAAFAAAALHEFGHALGLEHSNNVADVMYRALHNKPVVYLSDNDRDRIVKLYSYRP